MAALQTTAQAPITGRCTTCSRQATFDIETRPVAGLEAVTEYIVVCRRCGTATHSCWMNAALEQLQAELQPVREPIRHAKLARQFKRKFDAFQEMMTRHIVCDADFGELSRTAAAPGEVRTVPEAAKHGD